MVVDLPDILFMLTFAATLLALLAGKFRLAAGLSLVLLLLYFLLLNELAIELAEIPPTALHRQYVVQYARIVGFMQIPVAALFTFSVLYFLYEVVQRVFGGRA